MNLVSRNGWTVGLIFFAFVTTALAQNSGSQQVEAVLHTQVEAWNRGDLDGFMMGYWHSPDLTFFSGDAEAKGWQAAMDRYQKRYKGEGQSMGHLDFSELRVEMLSPEAAFVRGRWHLKMPDGKEPHGLFTLVFRKLDGQWRIVHDHTSGG